MLVALEKQGTGVNFNTRVSNSTHLSLHDDSVTVLGDGIDIGGHGFGSTAP